MPKKSAKEKPDYVMEFEKTKPKNTEIKNFGDNWYLYERYNYYDKITKKPKKISGPMIGTITPNGLIPCSRRKKGRGHVTLYQQYMSDRKQQDTTGIVSGDHTVSESDPPCEDKGGQEIQERFAVQDDSVIQDILEPQDGPKAPEVQDGPKAPEPQGDLESHPRFSKELEDLGQVMHDLNEVRVHICKLEDQLAAIREEKQNQWVKGVRTWTGLELEQRPPKDSAALMVGVSLDQFDEILNVLTEHPDFSDDEVADVLGWR